MTVTAPRPSAADTVRDFAERAASSFAEQFIGVLWLAAVGTTVKVAGLPWAVALGTGLGAAIVSILLTGLQYAGRLHALPFWLDVLVRGAKTFIASFLASAGGKFFDVFHFSWVTALNVAAVAAIAALAKSYLSPNAHLSGSLLPAPTVARIHHVQLNGNAYHRAA